MLSMRYPAFDFLIYFLVTRQSQDNERNQELLITPLIQ